jgi:hypothetical protein
MGRTLSAVLPVMAPSRDWPAALAWSTNDCSVDVGSLLPDMVLGMCLDEGIFDFDEWVDRQVYIVVHCKKALRAVFIYCCLLGFKILPPHFTCAQPAMTQ